MCFTELFNYFILPQEERILKNAYQKAKREGDRIRNSLTNHPSYDQVKTEEELIAEQNLNKYYVQRVRKQLDQHKDMIDNYISDN